MSETVDTPPLRIYAVQTFTRFVLSDGRVATIQIPLEEVPASYPDTIGLAGNMVDQHGYKIRQTLQDGGIEILDQAATQGEING